MRTSPFPVLSLLSSLALVVQALLVPRQSRPRRYPEPIVGSGSGAAPIAGRSAASRPRVPPSEWIGRSIRSVLSSAGQGSVRKGDPLAAAGRVLGALSDRTVSLLVVLIFVTALGRPGWLLVGIPMVAIMIWAGKRRYERLLLRTHTESLQRALPALVDIFRAGIAAGALPRNVVLAIEQAPFTTDLSVLDPALRSIARDVRSGVGFADALDQLRIFGPTVDPFISVLQSAERYGLPLGPALDALAVDARQARRRSVETRARRLPVTLLFPLVVCNLPSFVLLTVAPLLIAGLSSVQW